jgi:hypothetical protein
MEAFERMEAGVRFLVPENSMHRDAASSVPAHADTLVWVEIGEIALSGVSLAPGSEQIMRSALETELARLLASGPLPPRLTADWAVSGLPGHSLEIAGESDPRRFGRSIAAALYRGLGR